MTDKGTTRTHQEVRLENALHEAFECGRVYQLGDQKQKPWEAEAVAVKRAKKIFFPKRKP